MTQSESIKDRHLREWLAKGGNISVHKKPEKPTGKRKEEIAVRRRKWEKERRTKKPMLVCTQKTRAAFSRVFRGGRGFFENELGRVLIYSRDDLVKHMEDKFTEEMSWDNYGKVWHMDHIKPVSSFYYESIYDKGFLECWDLINLQPLTPSENREKWYREK